MVPWFCACKHLMRCEEFAVRLESFKMVSVDTERRRNGNWYVILCTQCCAKILVNKWWYTQKNCAVSKVNNFPQTVSTNCRYYLVMLFLHGASFLNRARNSRCTVITDLDTSKRSTQKAFSCCDAIWETGPAVSMRSELLVAHEKLGQLLLLLTVYIVPVV